MSGVLQHRLHRRGESLHLAIASAFISAGSLLLALITLVVLILGVFLLRPA